MPQTPKEVTGVAPDIERVVKKRYERRQLQVQTEQEDGVVEITIKPHISGVFCLWDDG